MLLPTPVLTVRFKGSVLCNFSTIRFRRFPCKLLFILSQIKKNLNKKKRLSKKFNLRWLSLSKPPYLVQWSLLIGQPLSSILLFRSSSAVQLSFYLTKFIFTVCALQVLVRTKPVTFRIFCPLYFPVNKQNYRSKE